MSLHVTLHPTAAMKRRLLTPVNELHFNGGVTLLAGPNGSGKSTILSAFRKGEGLATKTTTGLTGDLYLLPFDFERDNPRVANFQEALERGASAFAAHFGSKAMSHGQSTKQLLSELRLQLANPKQVLLLDEPDQGLDFDGVQQLRELLHTAVAPLVLVAVHSPYLLLDPGFQVLELQPGYLATLRTQLHTLVG